MRIPLLNTDYQRYRPRAAELAPLFETIEPRP